MVNPSKSIQARALSLLVRLLLYCLKHARFLGNADLSLLLDNNIDKLLNLPGKLPFFPTQTSDVGKIKALLAKLHPITCSKELIRLGPDGDGGYLVPNDLDGIEACFSPGVSNIAGFEMDCAEMGMKVFMADGSVERPPVTHPQFAFIQKFIGANTEGAFLSLEDWVNKAIIDSSSDLLLQIDIEGYEYETLLSASSSFLARFRIIVIECHYLDYLFCAPVFAIYSRVFERILGTHTCVHIHPNNICSTLTGLGMEMLQMAEFTFLRNDRISNRAFATVFPHPLDRDNSGMRSYGLPKSFYRAE